MSHDVSLTLKEIIMKNYLNALRIIREKIPPNETLDQIIMQSETTNPIQVLWDNRNGIPFSLYTTILKNIYHYGVENENNQKIRSN